MLLFILLLSLLHAADPGYCQDLKTHACQNVAPGGFPRLDDKMGGGNDSVAALAKLKADVAKAGTEAEAQIANLLNTDPRLKQEVARLKKLKRPKLTGDTAALVKALAKAWSPFSNDEEKTIPLQSGGLVEYSHIGRYDYRSHPQIKKIRETSFDQVAGPRKSLLENKLMPAIQEVAAQVIDGLPLSAAQKTKMKRALAAVRLEVQHCPNYGLHADNVREEKLLIYCLDKALVTPSLFTAAMVLGHELAHTIDPCDYPDTKRLTGLIHCLRSAKSAHALEQKGCMKAQGDDDRTSDMLSEGFSDWFGVEVLGRMMSHPLFARAGLNPTDYANGFSNPFVDDRLCGETSAEVVPGKDNHAPMILRMNAMVLTHPQIRQRLGCTSPHQKFNYCPANPAEETAQGTPIINQ